MDKNPEMTLTCRIENSITVFNTISDKLIRQKPRDTQTQITDNKDDPQKRQRNGMPYGSIKF